MYKHNTDVKTRGISAGRLHYGSACAAVAGVMVVGVQCHIIPDDMDHSNKRLDTIRKATPVYANYINRWRYVLDAFWNGSMHIVKECEREAGMETIL